MAHYSLLNNLVVNWIEIDKDIRPKLLYYLFYMNKYEHIYDQSIMKQKLILMTLRNYERYYTDKDDGYILLEYINSITNLRDTEIDVILFDISQMRKEMEYYETVNSCSLRRDTIPVQNVLRSN